jgi:hypothetical protein
MAVEATRWNLGSERVWLRRHMCAVSPCCIFANAESAPDLAERNFLF